MKEYTFDEVVEELEKCGCNLADVAVGRMMDIIEEQTGIYPKWSDIAPDWVLRNCFGR